MPMKTSSLGLILCLSLNLLACGEISNHSSGLDGHFEGSAEAQFTRKADAQRATAEWEPSRGVVISQLLITRFGKIDMAKAIIDSGVAKLWIVAPKSSKENLASSIFRDLRKALGPMIDKVELIAQQQSGDTTVWARDWAPQGALAADGGLRLLDFNYFPERGADDYTAQSMERLLKFDRLSVPVYNEGGNFMTNRNGDCLMTTRVTDANEAKEIPADMELDAAEIQNYYKKAAGCKNVRILPRMPFEGTGHIDMWAKFLNDDTVIVSELRDEVFALYTSEKSRNKAQKIKKFLDERAKDIEDLGFHVARIPMPGPIFEGKEVYRSYTNSLLVNKMVIVPRYRKPQEDDIATYSGKYFDQTLLNGYEKEVRALYEKYGYGFEWVNADDLIYNGGAVHCTTMQLPL